MGGAVEGQGCGWTVEGHGCGWHGEWGRDVAGGEGAGVWVDSGGVECGGHGGGAGLSLAWPHVRRSLSSCAGCDEPLSTRS